MRTPNANDPLDLLRDDFCLECGVELAVKAGGVTADAEPTANDALATETAAGAIVPATDGTKPLHTADELDFLHQVGLQAAYLL